MIAAVVNRKLSKFSRLKTAKTTKGESELLNKQEITGVIDEVLDIGRLKDPCDSTCEALFCCVVICDTSVSSSSCCVTDSSVCGNAEVAVSVDAIPLFRLS